MLGESGSRGGRGASGSTGATGRSGVQRYPSVARGFVKPGARMIGSTLVNRDTGAPVYLRGAGVSVGACLDPTPTLYRTIVSLFHASYLTIRCNWDELEPDRPTGGDPQAANRLAGATRHYDATWLAKLDEIMDWCEANGVWFVLRSGHTGADGSAYMGGSGGWVDWLYDDWFWSGAARQGLSHSISDLPGARVAPLPVDRTHYGSAYPTGSTGQTDSDTAFYMPYAGDADLAHYPNMQSQAGVQWRGDAEAVAAYYLPVLQMLEARARGRRRYLGAIWHQEADPGKLNAAFNFPSGTYATNRLLRTITTLYNDPLREDDPYRVRGLRGQGGHNYLGTADFSIAWTGGVGGGGLCPSGYHFLIEQHYYISGLSTYIAPDYDAVPDNFTLAGSATPTIYNPTVAAGRATYVDQTFDIADAIAKRWGIGFHVGEAGIGGGRTGAAQYMTDIGKAAARNKTHIAAYFIGTGSSASNQALLNDLGNDTYSLKATTGQAWADQLAIPY